MKHVSLCQSCVYRLHPEMLTTYCMPNLRCDNCRRIGDLALCTLKGGSHGERAECDRTEPRHIKILPRHLTSTKDCLMVGMRPRRYIRKMATERPFTPGLMFVRLTGQDKPAKATVAHCAPEGIWFN